MKNFEIDWRQFFDVLPEYRQLSAGAREALIANPPHNSLAVSRIAEWSPFRDLIQRGIYVPTSKGADVALARQYHALAKVLRAMDRNPIDAGTAQAFDRYIADTFTREEWVEFHASEWWRKSREGLYAKIATIDWLKSFLNSDAVKWEDLYLPDSDANLFATETGAALKIIIKHLM